MPSLQALADFKSSFERIGGEEQARIARNIPADDSPLPDFEPKGLSPEAGGAGAFDGSPASFDDALGNGDSASDPPDEESGGFIDFGDLGDLVGGRIGLDEVPAPDIESFDSAGEEMAALLDSFPAETGEAESAEAGEMNAAEEAPLYDESAGVPSGVEDGDLNFGDLPDFPETDEPVNAGESAGLLSGVGVEDDDLNFGDLPDFPDTDEPVNAEESAELLSGVDVDDDLNFGDLPDFPETDEPVNAEESAELASGVEDDDLNFGDLPDFPETDEAVNAEESAGLLSGVGVEDDDLNFGDLPDFPDTDETVNAEESAGLLSGVEDDDLNFGDLPDFPDTDEAVNAEESAGLPSGVEDDLNFGDLPDFPEVDEAVNAEENDELLSDVEDDDLDLGDLPDFPDADEAGDAFGSDANDEFDSGGMDLGGEDMGGPLSPPLDDVLAEEPVSDETLDLSFSEDDGDLELPGESFLPDSSSGDSFDNFNFDNDALAADFHIDVNQDFDGGAGGDFSGFDEFSLPEVDSVFGGAAQSAPARESAAPLDAREMLGEAEEIQLNDREFAKFRETLSSYPLNLRIACEQLIAEEAVAPDLMANLVRLLVQGAPPKETAALAGKILGKTITIPKAYEKKTGEDLEIEQGSFAYIFVHNFLPVFRLLMGIVLVALSLGYLVWKFIYLPGRAESLYKQGYEQIAQGEYNWANRRFEDAFQIHPKKEWFYRYAEAFRDERQYIEAERKYRELMYYTASKNKRGIPEKRAVLDYAGLMTNYTRDYERADELLRRNILDYSVWDREALLALGDNSLAWGEIDPARLEDAREAYARLLERYGQSDPVLERMLLYFVRTDSLREVLPLQEYFMYSEKRRIGAPVLAELGGYLLDKLSLDIRGVPDENRDNIKGIREVLLRAVRTNQVYPESYYHLARYYEHYNNTEDEALTLERALMAFDAARQETPKRLNYNIDALRRYAEILLGRREFFPAEEQLIKAANLYESGLARRVIERSPGLGRLYADLGDIEYFVKAGDTAAVLDYYGRAENSGYAPPELLYRMGAAHYQRREWPEALDRFAAASAVLPLNRRILYSLGNVSYLRGNYYAAQGYYDRLLELLDADRARFPLIMPTENEEQLELAERLMVAQNNMGVVLEALTTRTGDNKYRSRALGLYSESERAWDVITRNPDSLVRMRPSPEITAPGVNPAYLNVQNSLRPVPGYEPQFFLHIDKDILEPSVWEELAPPSYTLSQGLLSGRR